jgi:eukaryotic-like serine/threonine-protein kinase
MNEANFSFDILDVPQPIKDKLRDLSQSFEITKRSRKGACGWLFFGSNRINSQRVAIKFYDWGGDSRYHTEPLFLSTIKSDNVIPILDASFVDKEYAYFLTPYYERGDLDEEICRGVQGNIRALNVARDVISGLSHLHASRLVHRDLKPQNVLIDDRNHAVIGDFGSVKRIPDGDQNVPGSGHSIIYRPPESVLVGKYGIPGDIYQVGVVLFQLLGGNIPYEESSWLSAKELKKYRAIQDGVDKQVFANDCIKKRIAHGKVVDVSTLPPWVCVPLQRVISKACNADPAKRFSSCNEFLARLSSIRRDIHDWRIEGGFPVRHGKTKYRIQFDKIKSVHFVEKEKGAGWRRDNAFIGQTISSLVKEVELRFPG